MSGMGQDPTTVDDHAKGCGIDSAWGYPCTCGADTIRDLRAALARSDARVHEREDELNREFQRAEKAEAREAVLRGALVKAIQVLDEVGEHAAADEATPALDSTDESADRGGL